MFVAGAELDPPLPSDWSPQKYATWSARLAGFGRSEASARAAAAIGRPKFAVRDALHPWAPRRRPSSRRAGVAIAAAVATGARVIAFEDPTPSLSDEASDRARAHVTARALAERDWLLFTTRAPLSSPLVGAADGALVLAGSTLADRGTPAELAMRAPLRHRRARGMVKR